MKFSDIEQNKWEALQPYLDTCLLPVTGLDGREQPWEATRKLEELRDLMDCLEKPFHGRLVTYPAMHYLFDESCENRVHALCEMLRETGFKYVIVVTVHPAYEAWNLPSADLLIGVNAEELQGSTDNIRDEIGQKVRQMWQSAV